MPCYNTNRTLGGLLRCGAEPRHGQSQRRGGGGAGEHPDRTVQRWGETGGPVLYGTTEPSPGPNMRCGVFLLKKTVFKDLEDLNSEIS